MAKRIWIVLSDNKKIGLKEDTFFSKKAAENVLSKKLKGKGGIVKSWF